MQEGQVYMWICPDMLKASAKKYIGAPEFQGIMLSPLSVLNHLIMEQD